MTLPSRRKLPITRRNTPTFARGAALALASVWLAAWGPAAQCEPLPRPERQAPAAAQPVDWHTSEPGAIEEPAAPPRKVVRRRIIKRIVKVPRSAVRPAAQDETADLRNVPSLDTVLDDTSEAPRTRRAIRRASQDEIEACERVDGLPEDQLAQNLAQEGVVDPVIEPETDLEARRNRFREQMTRPFKRIGDIRPFYDYEPDGEQRNADHCYNLCPRPGAPDCPECQSTDSQGNLQGTGVPCPDCPSEVVLADTERLVASVNDSPKRSFPQFHYCWEPTDLYAYPLYFEDFCLERYGHTRHYLIQPVFSVGLFAAQFVGLPYQMSIDPVWKRRYPLGYYRPGQYVPYKYYQVPWNTEAALTEAAVLTGATFLFAPSLSP